MVALSSGDLVPPRGIPRPGHFLRTVRLGEIPPRRTAATLASRVPLPRVGTLVRCARGLAAHRRRHRPGRAPLGRASLSPPCSSVSARHGIDRPRVAAWHLGWHDERSQPSVNTAPLAAQLSCSNSGGPAAWKAAAVEEPPIEVS